MLLILLFILILLGIIIIIYKYFHHKFHIEEFYLYRFNNKIKLLNRTDDLACITKKKVQQKKKYFIYNNERFMINCENRFNKLKYFIISMGSDLQYTIQDIPLPMMIFINKKLHFAHNYIKKILDLSTVYYTFEEIINIIHQEVINNYLSSYQWYENIYKNLLNHNIYQEIINNKMLIYFYKHVDRIYIMFIKLTAHDDVNKKINILIEQIEHLLLITNHQVKIEDPYYNWSNINKIDITLAENIPTSTGVLYYVPKSINTIYKIKTVVQDYFNITSVFVNTIVCKTLQHMITEQIASYTKQLNLLFDFFIYCNYYNYKSLYNGNSINLINKIQNHITIIDNNFAIKNITFQSNNNHNIFKSPIKKVDYFAKIFAHIIILSGKEAPVQVTWVNDNNNYHIIHINCANLQENQYIQNIISTINPIN